MPCCAVVSPNIMATGSQYARRNVVIFIFLRPRAVFTHAARLPGCQKDPSDAAHTGQMSVGGNMDLRMRPIQYRARTPLCFRCFWHLISREAPVAGFFALLRSCKLRISVASVLGVNLCVLVGALVAGRSWGSVLRRLRTIRTNIAVLSRSGAETGAPVVLGLPRGRAGAQKMPNTGGKALCLLPRVPRPRPNTPRSPAPF